MRPMNYNCCGFNFFFLVLCLSCGFNDDPVKLILFPVFLYMVWMYKYLSYYSYFARKLEQMANICRFFLTYIFLFLQHTDPFIRAPLCHSVACVSNQAQWRQQQNSRRGVTSGASHWLDVWGEAWVEGRSLGASMWPWRGPRSAINKDSEEFKETIAMCWRPNWGQVRYLRRSLYL